MAEALKHLIGPHTARDTANAVARAWAPFDREAFLAEANLGVHRHHIGEAHLVGAVIDAAADALHGQHARAQEGDERQGQVAVGDTNAERAAGGTHGIDMNPLVIARGIGEQIDLLLGDGEPVADGDLRAGALGDRHSRGRAAHGDAAGAGARLSRAAARGDAAAAAAEVAPAYDRLDPESELELEPEFEPKPAPVVEPAPEPVEVPSPAPAAVVAPAEDAPAPNDDALLAEVDLSIARGRLNHAAELLEPAVAQAPERSDLRLKLMEVYGQQGDRDAFVGQERQLVANGENFARVEELKNRFPAMAVVAAGGLAAAAVAAELDAQYVKDLLMDEPAAEEPALGDDDLDSAFDLSLDDLDIPVAAAPALEPEPQVLGELDEFPADDDLSFESVLQQQTEIKENLDDLSDFDLDMDLGAEPSPATLAEDDFLLSLDDDLKDLPVADAPVAPEVPLDDLELPSDFDLSLADEMDAPDAFAAELDDVNAELDRLSQSISEPTFTAEDAMASAADEPEFDFLSGTDEVATKLDLAQAYIDMGDADGARDILNEVVTEGNDGQKSEAKDMLSRLA